MTAFSIVDDYDFNHLMTINDFVSRKFIEENYYNNIYAKARRPGRLYYEHDHEKDQLKEQNEKQRKEIELLRKMLEGKLN